MSETLENASEEYNLKPGSRSEPLEGRLEPQKILLRTEKKIQREKKELKKKLANQSLTNSLSNSQFLENGKYSDSDRATNENLKESNARTINSPKHRKTEDSPKKVYREIESIEKSRVKKIEEGQQNIKQQLNIKNNP